jgi:hypothetical protein
MMHRRIFTRQAIHVHELFLGARHMVPILRVEEPNVHQGLCLRWPIWNHRRPQTRKGSDAEYIGPSKIASGIADGSYPGNFDEIDVMERGSPMLAQTVEISERRPIQNERYFDRNRACHLA